MPLHHEANPCSKYYAPTSLKTSRLRRRRSLLLMFRFGACILALHQQAQNACRKAFVAPICGITHSSQFLNFAAGVQHAEPADCYKFSDNGQCSAVMPIALFLRAHFNVFILQAPGFSIRKLTFVEITNICPALHPPHTSFMTKGVDQLFQVIVHNRNIVLMKL